MHHRRLIVADRMGLMSCLDYPLYKNKILLNWCMILYCTILVSCFKCSLNSKYNKKNEPSAIPLISAKLTVKYFSAEVWNESPVVADKLSNQLGNRRVSVSSRSWSSVKRHNEGPSTSCVDSENNKKEKEKINYLIQWLNTFRSSTTM